MSGRKGVDFHDIFVLTHLTETTIKESLIDSIGSVEGSVLLIGNINDKEIHEYLRLLRCSKR